MEGSHPPGESWSEISSECRGIQQSPSCPHGLLLHRRKTLAHGNTGGCESCGLRASGTWEEGLEAILSHWTVFVSSGPRVSESYEPCSKTRGHDSGQL